eukprot:500958_1
MATSFTLINDQSRHLCNYSCCQHLVDVSHWMSDTAWIEMSLSLSSLCDGASCAEWSLRLIVYVDAVNHDSDRYDPDIQMDAPFGLHIYDNGNWSRDWVCGDYWNNPFCDDMDGVITIDLPSSSGRSKLWIALESDCTGADEYCSFDSLKLKAELSPTSHPTTGEPTTSAPTTSDPTTGSSSSMSSIHHLPTDRTSSDSSTAASVLAVSSFGYEEKD